MSDVLSGLDPRDRRDLERQARSVGVAPEALAAGFIGAYLLLARDAAAALPRDPMRGVAVSAQRAQRRIGGGA